MPKHKDLKRQVRGRMRKTGESYTTARSRLLQNTKKAMPRGVAVPGSAGSRPAPSDFAKLAGMSDAAVRAKTGRTWEGWVRALDRAGAMRMAHREIAAYVRERHEVPGWWAQTVTVGYERIRGLRAIGQRRDGTYEANKSMTFAAPLARLYAAFRHRPTRRRWLPESLTIKTATRDKSMRIAWADGTAVEAYFTRKAAGRSQVAIQHRKLPDPAAAARMKEFWAERLAALAKVLG